MGLWVLLLAVYAATLTIPGAPTGRYGDDERHYLLAAESIVADGDIDLTDQYRERADGVTGARPLRPTGRRGELGLTEPQGVGFPLLIAPAWALGGGTGVQLLIAALAALGFVLAAALARRLVPDPWATGVVVVCALSPPVLAHATAVEPATLAGTVLAGAVLLALRARDAPAGLRDGLAAGAAVGLLPWLGVSYALAGVVVLAVLVRWLVRRGRGSGALLCAEVALVSAVVLVTVDDRAFGGLTPEASELMPGFTPDSPRDLLQRAPRLVSLWLDREAGLLRWAPLLAAAGIAAWLLWRSRRERVARAVPERLGVEIAAGLMLAVVAVQVLVAAIGSEKLAGPWFPGRALMPAVPLLAALAAWGVRHVPRAGAVLGVLTLMSSGWLLVALGVQGGAWAALPDGAPWGPLDAVLPVLADDGSVAARVVAGGVLVVVAGVVGVEALRRRRGAQAARAPG